MSQRADSPELNKQDVLRVDCFQMAKQKRLDYYMLITSNMIKLKPARCLDEMPNEFNNNLTNIIDKYKAGSIIQFNTDLCLVQ